ncbi:DnaJ-domain-containing protein [Meredithblackwellia eburnea MCA 4105]
MKLSPLIVGCAAVAVLSNTALAWTNEDHEIFDIVSALESAEGKGTTFYTFLNVTKSATEKDISKAYRKRSLELHPDKNPDDKVVAARFARLGTIAGILRDAEKRERYDHFHDNGVPRWRGTGYYYSRYRPGLSLVLVALTMFSAFIQYIFFLLQWGLSIQRIRMFQNQALEHAWGPTKKPLAGRKRLRVKTGEEAGPGIPGIAGGRPTRPGQTLDMVIEGENVYIVEKGKEILLTEDNALLPSVWDTWIPTLFRNTLARITGRPIPESGGYADLDEDGKPVPAAAANGKKEKEAPVVVKKPKGPAKPAEGAGKVAGRRRAGVPKRPEA